MRIPVLFFVCVLAAGCATAPPLAGTFDGATYTSPQGAFTVRNPLTGPGARVIGDDKEGVTFGDDFGNRIRFYGYRFNAGSKAALALKSEGPKKVLDDYFTAFFANPERRFYPDIAGGTMSSSYMKPPLTGAAAFVRNSRIYLAETSIANRVGFFTEGQPADAAQKLKEKYESEAIKLLQTITVLEDAQRP